MNTNGYRRLFNDIEPFYPHKRDLDWLAEIMSGKVGFFSQPEEITSFEKAISASMVETKKKNEIPQGYTYLSQFISHDLSFDEASDRHRREDFPSDIIDSTTLKKLKNLRTPLLNLEVIYGNENPINKNEIQRSKLFLEGYDLPLFRLGETLGNHLTAFYSYPNDLPRGKYSVKAEIVDPRNDENLLLAQTQVAFMKFHNALVVTLSKMGVFSREILFEKARKLAIRYYQKIIVSDLLPRIVQNNILEKISKKYELEELNSMDLRIPLEFSVAALRFGHSMIRNEYSVNKLNHLADLDNMMRFTGFGRMNGKDIFELPTNWIINWNNFYKIDQTKPDNAETIDTNISRQLLNLIPKPAHQFGRRESSLALLDLYRCRRFGLPCGQDLARRLGETVYSSEQISNLIQSKDVDVRESDLSVQDVKDRLKKVFSQKTPLWFYILAEAEIIGNGKMGETGSRILTETIYRHLSQSEYSILRYDWEEGEDFLLDKQDKSFKMAEMLSFIQSTTYNHFGELYPETYYPNTKNKFDELNPLENGYQ